MKLQEFIFAIVGLGASVAFSWAVSMDCSHPTAALFVYWFSLILFAMLGPLWAWQAGDSKMPIRASAATATVLIAVFALVGTLMLRPACAQTQTPNINCTNTGGSGSQTNNCGNNYNLDRAPSGLEIIGGPNGGTTAEIRSTGSPGAPSVGADVTMIIPPGQAGVGVRVIQTGPGTGLRVIQNGPGVGLKSTVIVGVPNN
jgi:hypothetical protein